MLTREIRSLQHPIVKHLVKLREEGAYRKENNSVLIMGIKLVTEIAARLPIKMLLVDKDAFKGSVQAEEVLHVNHPILKKITGLENPEPLAAVVELPKPATLNGKKALIALDGIADPGNLGTLLRSAWALGWEGVFLCQGTVDPFNDKALRAAKGATFFLPLFKGKDQELQDLIQNNHLHVYAAGLKGKSLKEVNISSPLLLILGNEAHGPRSLTTQNATLITIPMKTGVDSLNVASAGAILMHALKP